MILVDSSVWIDYFRGSITAQAEMLDRLLGNEPLAVGDLILTEVLQGFTDDRSFKESHKLLTSLTIVELGGKDIAVQAARNIRVLRKLGVAVRKTIDTVIAIARRDPEAIYWTQAFEGGSPAESRTIRQVLSDGAATLKGLQCAQRRALLGRRETARDASAHESA